MRRLVGQMKLVKLSTLIFSIALTPNVFSAPLLGKAPLHDVIASMTLEEKIKLVRGTGMDISVTTEQQGNDGSPAVGETDKGRVEGAAGNTYAIPRLGIPSIVLADGPAGLRIQPLRKDDPGHSYYCTAFPIATLLASSWDTSLVEEVGEAIGEEVKEYGVDILLAPGMNIQRFPLGGRNFEYYSEDPLLTGKLAAAMVRGVQSNGVGTSVKHYVANNHEWNRNKINVQVDEKALREIYLKGFEIAIKESKPWTVMSSYNKINGNYTSESYDILTETLRNKWGFDGFVMSDWFGGTDAVAQIEAGNDLLMPGTDRQESQLLDAAKNGSLDLQALDRSVEDILRIIMRTPTFKEYKYSNKPDLKGNAGVARRAAAEGMVLLKNAGQVLPLKPASKMAIFGNTSYRMITGGTGSGDVNEAYSVSLLDGVVTQGFAVDSSIGEKYEEYLVIEEAKRPKPKGLEAFLAQPLIPELKVNPQEIDRAAAENDIALITIGRNSGEFADRDPSHFSINADELQMLQMISSAFRKVGKPVLAILNIGGPIEMVSWRDQVDAILLAWQPGQEAGHAITDVLTGNITPSGKLAATFPVNLTDVPAAKGFPGKVDNPEQQPTGVFRSQPSAVTYTDGYNVGYRYFNAYNKDVAYPFGHGLSYTTFGYTNIHVSEMNDAGQLTVSVTVKNTGNYSGKEVVQLYAYPKPGNRDGYPTQLRAFAKTRLLRPGDAETLTFLVRAEQLAEYYPNLGDWRAQAGKYELAIGSSSRDIRSRKAFTLSRTIAK